MARLRDAVFFKLIEVRKDFITCVAETVQDLSLRRALIGTGKPAHILRDEPSGLKMFKSLNSVLIKQAVFTVQAFMFADDGKIITRKAERQRVDRFKLVEVQIANVAANDAFGLIGANISFVSRAGRRVDVVRPSVNNLCVGLNIGMSRAPGQTTRSREQLTEFESFHAAQVLSLIIFYLANSVVTKKNPSLGKIF